MTCKKNNIIQAEPDSIFSTEVEPQPSSNEVLGRA